jgi:hypothetical protein
MKRSTRFYWFATGLMAAFMGIGAAFDVAAPPEAAEVFTHLGYPLYFLPYIGVLKLLGVAAVLLPVNAWIKEWAYAGLFFDVMSALYSAIAVGDAPLTWIPAFAGMVLVGGSYALYRRQAVIFSPAWLKG